jgi:hypothetical protein
MDSFLSLLRLALDRSWAVGGLLALFFGGILVAEMYGLQVPDELQRWSTAGVAFGLAVLVVSLASHAAQIVGTWLNEWRLRRRLRSTLTDLTKAEKEFLRPYILQNENTRHQSIYDGVANGLEAKGIIYRASNFSVPGTPGIPFPWNLQPGARTVLNKKRHLLE